MKPGGGGGSVHYLFVCFADSLFPCIFVGLHFVSPLLGFWLFFWWVAGVFRSFSFSLLCSQVVNCSFVQ